MDEFKIPKQQLAATTGEVVWQSPSNIALIKYWGKYGNQLPKNPSISFTLSNAYTETSIKYKSRPTESDVIDLSFYFEGKKHDAFEKRIKKFIESLTTYFPFILQLSFEINSKNSFPHSTGIASSASAMSALALCLCDMEQLCYKTLPNKNAFLKKASFISRLGSGSACRSIYPKVALWGGYDSLKESSNYWAIDYSPKVHPIFHTFHDSILIVSGKEKAVSSTAGHALMDNNPYAAIRYQSAIYNMLTISEQLKSGDLVTFGEVVEQEALGLHALMMTSKPSYILMRPNTLKIIEKVRAFRRNTNTPVYFTLDAGPNIHLLYPDNVEKSVKDFISSELLIYCDEGRCIHDKIGAGPIKIK